MLCFDLFITLFVTVVTFGTEASDRQSNHVTRSYAVRGSNKHFNPLIRYPLRFVGKREGGVDNVDDIHSDRVAHSENKRKSPNDADAKLKLLETIIQDIRTLEIQQDDDFQQLLEKHKDQLQQLYSLLPASLDRRLFNHILRSLMKRRFIAMGHGRDSNKRPSFNAWGGKRKRSESNIDEHAESAKRVAETVDDYTLQDDDLEDDKRASFNAWGGKRNAVLDQSSDLSAERAFDWSGIALDHSRVMNDLSPHSISDTPEPTLEDDDDVISGHLYVDDDMFNEPGLPDNAGITTTNKRGFNAWGGKRGFNAWGGKRSFSPYVPGNPDKRANFNPWGGKRSGSEIAGGAGKRAGFNAWGGKRAAAIRSVDKAGNGEGENSDDLPPALLNIEFDTFYPRN